MNQFPTETGPFSGARNREREKREKVRPEEVALTVRGLF